MGVIDDWYAYMTLSLDSAAENDDLFISLV
jgi:hypothetical protein